VGCELELGRGALLGELWARAGLTRWVASALCPQARGQSQGKLLQALFFPPHKEEPPQQGRACTLALQVSGSPHNKRLPQICAKTFIDSHKLWGWTLKFGFWGERATLLHLPGLGPSCLRRDEVRVSHTAETKTSLAVQVSVGA
jgi:hypothetical protein